MTPSSFYTMAALTARGRARYGAQFDPSDLDPRCVAAYEGRYRIAVTFTRADGTIRVQRGYVGVTSGWKPCFMLLLRRNSLSSSELLLPQYQYSIQRLPEPRRRATR